MEPKEAPTQKEIELPASTAWPLIAALGVVLVFASLVTAVPIGVVGALLAIAAAVGWTREVLPRERCERVHIAEPPGAPEVRRVVPAHGVGERGHRLRLPVEVHPYSAGVRAGLAGGAAMALVACTYGLIAQGSLWYPINLLAAVVMPGLANSSLAALRAFHPLAFAIACVVHGGVSMGVGLLYAVILPTLAGRALVWGGVVAPLLWSGGLWGSLGVINPALNARIDWGWFVASQVAFGLVAGYVMEHSTWIRTVQALPLADRLRLERGPRGVRRNGEPR